MSFSLPMWKCSGKKLPIWCMRRQKEAVPTRAQRWEFARTKSSGDPSATLRQIEAGTKIMVLAIDSNNWTFHHISLVSRRVPPWFSWISSRTSSRREVELAHTKLNNILVAIDGLAPKRSHCKTWRRKKEEKDEDDLPIERQWERRVKMKISS